MKTMKYISSISIAMLVVLAIFALQAMAASSVGSVTRSLSATTVAPGATFAVTITPSSNLSVSPVWGIEETIPSGFTLVSTTAFINLTTATNIQRFSQSGSNAFTYTLVAPTSPGTYAISGTFVDADTNTGTIAPSTVTVGSVTPTPTNIPTMMQTLTPSPTYSQTTTPTSKPTSTPTATLTPSITSTPTITQSATPSPQLDKTEEKQTQLESTISWLESAINSIINRLKSRF